MMNISELVYGCSVPDPRYRVESDLAPRYLADHVDGPKYFVSAVTWVNTIESKTAREAELEVTMAGRPRPPRRNSWDNSLAISDHQFYLRDAGRGAVGGHG